MSSTQAIRAGRAFVELFADDSKLVRGLRRAEMKVRAFGNAVAGIGRRIMMLGTAALALEVFGRSGTGLLPMFAQGAAGIERLQAEARRLGLMMSGEDARAAEQFNDTLDALWKTVKMGASGATATGGAPRSANRRFLVFRAGKRLIRPPRGLGSIRGAARRRPAAEG